MNFLEGPFPPLQKLYVLSSLENDRLDNFRQTSLSMNESLTKYFYIGIKSTKKLTR